MPAPPVALDDIFQVTLLGEWEGETIMNVTNWRVKNLADPGEYLADAQSIATHFGTVGVGKPLVSYLACLATNVTVLTSRAQRIYAPRSAFVDQAVNEDGTGSGVCNTGNICAAVTRKTDLAGRDQVSISHIGPIAGLDVIDGHLGNPLKGALVTWATNWTQTQIIAGGSGIELDPVVFHRNLVPPAYNSLRAFYVNPYVRTMRRRTVRVGI